MSIRCMTIAAFGLIFGSTANAQTPGPIPHPCLTMPQAHQFDFWIGQWDVTPWQVKSPTPAQQMGFNDVHPILEHCVLSENWKATRGGEDGAMRFTGWTLDAKGNRVEQKLTFFAIAPDTVRQLFESSTDAGKTWTPSFDGRYVKRH
jgi:hypothetical protein